MSDVLDQYMDTMSLGLMRVQRLFCCCSLHCVQPESMLQVLTQRVEVFVVQRYLLSKSKG